MGKNKYIKSLGKCIGNIVLHKILVKHTNKPESEKHLSDEIRDYSADVFEKAQEFTWTDEEKEEIKDKAVNRVKHLIKNYPEFSFSEKEVLKLIEESMDEMLL
ncbi:hypothetical protein CMO89_01120 [Candidatus Woesearchaeota archaeon]|nr:hypothetical protein [Candidatus Woesearchaeota archaeon]|tara:strand:+ start:6776 stop:7084 length:309 start_codon:yes stop_codon:yes gene_type:complete